MPRDTQIFSGASEDGNSDYLLPGNSEITVLAVTATFTDNGAAVDWCPTVEMISDSGHTIARAMLPDVKVTAGDDAEVSWFPGVKPSAAATLSALNQSGLAQGVIGQVIPSGVVTTLAWTAFTSAPGYGRMFGTTPGTSNPVTFAKFATVVATLTVSWPAANFDRYSELAIGAPSAAENIASPRIRHGLSPDGDLQTLAAVIAGDPFNPTTITAQVFQASGVNRAVTAGISYHSIPYGVAPFVAP